MERRRSQRIAVNLEVEASVTDDAPRSVVRADPVDDNIERVSFSTEGAGQFFDAQMMDLSVNGARLSSETRPPLLSRMSLSFSFAEFKHVQATALVMWRTRAPSPQGQYSFGVLFEAIPVDVRMSIHKLITSQNA
ncbi:PilZ domain-containing protein [Cystobacter fuscus]|uniref:PilZ domain-containing protein n=1 Tax=Cystobacter fuscus TaxID=43 RepID=UPI002B27DF5E|nr:PilZ domain-containing protein [Cystobacter fuscus]